MAIDPATAKILVQVAVKAVSDEETRKRLFMVILAPTIGVLLLIALILHLITSPLSFLSSWLIGDEVTLVEEFQKDYGYNQVIGIYDTDYEESYGTNYEGVTFTSGATAVAYYNQLDERWADKPYGKTGTIGSSGCGPTSMSIVVSTLTEKSVDPPHMADWAYKNGYRCEGNGSYHSLIPAAARNWGLTVKDKLTAQGIVDALSNGKLVVAIMAKGHFTKGGHYIVLRGITEDGKILVADPASVSRSNQEWDLSIILNEARKGAAAGGPFWSIGM